MTNPENKQFQYEKQDYQETCVHNIVSIFERLHRKENFVQVMKEHHNNHTYNFSIQNTKNIDNNDGNGNGKDLYFYQNNF